MIRATAPGKINLYFAVGPKLANGYHEVCSVYLALNLRETVGVDFAPELSISVDGTLAQDHLNAVPRDETNLVVRAGRLVSEVPLRFEITKQVPVAGGMGGGSADAAAALVATEALTGLMAKQDVVTLGADVPFALMGGVALGTGVGEKLLPLNMKGELHIVLITSAGGLSTPTVYAKLDELREGANLVPETAPQEPKELIAALAAGDIGAIARLAHNDLQWAALELKPELQDIIDRAKAAGALTALVSGSGPTVFAIASDSKTAHLIAEEFGSAAVVTSGPATGARLEN
ncbi:MAG: 4-(cytidine 5'-diphospho)-2-C-methyl-D-erythritol kinase [Micrococcales bacterium]